MAVRAAGSFSYPKAPLILPSSSKTEVSAPNESVATSSLFEDGQAIKDHAFNVLCSAITRQYHQIVFPEPITERRDWFRSEENQATLQQVPKLVLAHKKLKEVPPEIGYLKALEHPDLCDNELTTLPPEIGYLKALEHLDLCNNKLATLPAELENLKTLKHLILAQNRLERLPPEIGNFIALETLDLSSNRLSTLPPEIRNLASP